MTLKVAQTSSSNLSSNLILSAGIQRPFSQ